MIHDEVTRQVHPGSEDVQMIGKASGRHDDLRSVLWDLDLPCLAVAAVCIRQASGTHPGCSPFLQHLDLPRAVQSKLNIEPHLVLTLAPSLFADVCGHLPDLRLDLLRALLATLGHDRSRDEQLEMYLNEVEGQGLDGLSGEEVVSISEVMEGVRRH